ncbi:vacuolar endopolyphosphatase [Blastomyces dermatitidis ER-3]|uniref:Endopolyphosphatase n=1 Tax=Ajellomyces dermatitidis (strain ER-3 / ATCC MYA-2586) TaxID=559297 RepID=A0ABP2ERT7_AJEDR|nr:vacuolar endopolyphosphatase [Blastomyces dermatitidis ER-3]EEQ85194.1 vacuolar endopolyphosphatase [Blastomyces dermatitidis ER-3]
MVKFALAISLLASWPLRAFAGNDLGEAKTRKLHGRFLHITDIHADTNYKPNSNTDGDHECHRGSGNAGFYGTVGSNCDSPLTLVNATFAWIQENLAHSIDFVVWTGDSARHDNDEKIPRTEQEILHMNQLLADKFHDIFSKSDEHKKGMRIPVVPTIGNNDIMPHNILKKGPNHWTKRFARIWDNFIPEEQRHSFVQGGWFYVEVIPHKLAVISLNTMYFYGSNSAVDGCAHRDDPGYEHMEWLRVQLQFMRKRNMKAILIGHVPPARTSSKENWDATCWQKYTLWLQQYRDVIVASMFGHMNIDHFMFQDSNDLKIGDKGTESQPTRVRRRNRDDQVVSVQARMNYLTNLRHAWSQLPSPPSASSSVHFDDKSQLNDEFGFGSALDVNTRGKKKEMRKYLEEIGGPWAERYSVSLVSPSIIPNYYPTLRVIEYNISGLENAVLWSEITAHKGKPPQQTLPLFNDPDVGAQDPSRGDEKKGKKKKKKPKKPKFEVPEPPSPTAPPGPAYSNQPFTLLSYTQYFFNLTELENVETIMSITDRLHDQKHLSWREYRSRKSGDAHKPNNISFEVFYDTKTDRAYNLKDLTVNSYLDLARGIAEKERSSGKGTKADVLLNDNIVGCPDGEAEIPPTGEGKGDEWLVNENEDPSLDSRCTRLEPSLLVTKSRESLWSVFVRRAFVGFVNGNT